VAPDGREAALEEVTAGVTEDVVIAASPLHRVQDVQLYQRRSRQCQQNRPAIQR
jgi:hypothetical protein